MTATTTSAAFVSASVRQLRDTYLPRLRRAVGTLGADGVWWRPHEGTTSAGNLLLHLEGNVRQWILSGLAGEPDAREREGEFEAREGGDAVALLAALERTLARACEVVAGLDERALLAEHRIQGYEVRGLEAVYHVVEHFGWHVGQVTWIAKLRAGPGHGLAFYDDDRLDRPDGQGC